MASPEQVKIYLAQWFQVGKKLVVRNGEQSYCPSPILQNGRYSDTFEQFWHFLNSPDAGVCYLEGTEQTLQDLLSSGWDLYTCPRCQLPVPISKFSWLCTACPCSDMNNWPNLHLPLPHLPVNTHCCLRDICSRLSEV